ncbi:hypothetical protein GCM10011583_01500 [Streptomyces camponoticapitis]|uniref:DUF4188 domain-containing protein n=1 Tax=Streptomyces camponoticapitis TaxID=1616125 RepID=A0ABQ2DVF5_9ACTN|nr:DUF4188 domain-containing protein [Streptomyces camponoticapitis]GGJ73783.1 hypothetical protein GCM10011583_01500 [Streptomyces camponoticapitis]
MRTELIDGRMTADANGDVVVFLIGMRVNNFRALRSWWPVFTAMPRMLKELSRDKGSGLLGFQSLLGFPRVLYVVQYWDSKEKLFAYASARDGQHRPAWAEFNRRLRAGKGKVGFWHETYVVPAGSYESVYINMPAFGLGAATEVVPVGRRGESAADRLGS